ncbi:hypothetical protein C8R44DRAFT_904546 [Mycena epipterygia]|nr:hypothetical protein C8R44DRAFT_904546 [Mycena epipterygia]
MIVFSLLSHSQDWPRHREACCPPPPTHSDDAPPTPKLGNISLPLSGREDPYNPQGLLFPDGTASEHSYPLPTSGSKHSHDYSVDNFSTDMKKRRLSSSYDPRMAECLDRLNHISYPHHHGGVGFNLRSMSLDIRTPEELAAVNDFLITLSHDVLEGAPRP